MKKYLPLILFIIGLGVVTAALVFIIKGRQKEKVKEETASLREIPLEERPIVTLTPSKDGHWLTLKIEKIKIEAASLDYELLYKLPDGRTQGVPGTIKLDGQKTIERELLLGSESSGKFRYDEGVEKGTLTLRFRDKKGKLVVKFSTEFRLLSDTSKIISADGKFSVKLPKRTKTFLVVMETFGIPDRAPGKVLVGPYGIFSSSDKSISGKVELPGGSVYRWTGSKWSDNTSSSILGIFIAISS
jgi:hypothetical protein